MQENPMQINTHQNIDRKLCGDPIEMGAGDTGEGHSRVAMVASKEMAVDKMGLTHGGFIFGLADHAAMIAVNHLNVVLGTAEVKFLKPVKTGDRVEAAAKVTAVKGKKHVVAVTVHTKVETVFEGVFSCFTLDTHVLNAHSKRNENT